MKVEGETISLNSGDVVGHLACRHYIELERRVAYGDARRPQPWDPMLDVLWERGSRHERDYLDHLTAQGLVCTTIDGIDVTDDAVASTLAAMQAGAPVIVQAALRVGTWVGRADVLRRIETPSALGFWSYEVHDTKLARETKAKTVLQLALYSEMLGEMQGAVPLNMHVVPPWTDFVAESYRVADYAAFHRHVRAGLEATIARGPDASTYPEPTAHCDICAWRGECDTRRRADDHLSLVANISKMQIGELVENGVTTLAQLAAMPLPLQWRPRRGSRSSYERVREQARIQFQSREAGPALYEAIVPEPGFGLASLPAPDAGDVFLDFEGDAFAGEHGQEYLVGYHYVGDDGEPTYTALWGLTREAEKAAFETFVDFIMERWRRHPGMHIYHYGGYEPGALKRLMGRHATREDELDAILRGLLPVDLLTVVRQGVRAGVESYSIKRLEPLYGYERVTGLPDANLALVRLQTALELGDLDDLTLEDTATVQSYNQDDCVSTRHLRDWLEGLRSALIDGGVVVDRPAPGDPAPAPAVAEWVQRIAPLVASLTADVPADPVERTAAQHGRWLLGNMLDWHRREAKANWWEFFRLRDLPADDLIEEKSGLAGLTFIATVGGTAKCPVDRYAYLPQEFDGRPGTGVKAVGGDTFGTIEALSADTLTVDVKKTGASAHLHPDAVFTHEHVGSEAMAESLVRLAVHVVANGIEGPGPYRAGRDLLLRARPRTSDDSALRGDAETTLEAATRLALLLDHCTLPVQGPPGAGKTHTGAEMIVALVRAGRKVGIVANSHAVIRNLLDAAIRAAEGTGTPLRCVQKPKEREPSTDRRRVATTSGQVFAALDDDCQVAGGTAWLWSTPDAFESVDVLFVDEAAQMALANVLAVSQAATSVVLLGDPRKLDQPMQGSHPDGTDRSALDHIVDGRGTIGPDEGLFLEETWRLHPDICAFTSELFYEVRLTSRAGLERQVISAGPVAGAGLRYLPVEHTGNRNLSTEEAAAVTELVEAILASGATWTDRNGTIRPVGPSDILVITPYNAQVFEIQRLLPHVRVGTVDKFQGQEAPIAIYSLATSSHADAPRGMEFLYSLNRLNVATSRARCTSVLVSSPRVLEVDCRSPSQMRLASAFCRLLELAQPVDRGRGRLAEA